MCITEVILVKTIVLTSVISIPNIPQTATATSLIPSLFFMNENERKIENG